MTNERRGHAMFQVALSATGVLALCQLSLADELMEIIVEAPAVHVQKAAGRTQPLGAPVDIYSVRYHVSYGDLDLGTPGGAAALEQRVNDAAKRACKDLETLYPNLAPPPSGTPPCIKSATNGGMAQAHKAIAAAQGRTR